MQRALLGPAAQIGVRRPPGDITSQATRIQAQAVASDAMPLGNVTGMTEAERAALAAWIAAGASVK